MSGLAEDRSESPRLGEHNAEVLGGTLGLSEKDLGALQDRGIV
jgi:crotonobetainyl-CoA:carnitine CoA-transferase CaiB-like acyl-CoA transferase